MAVKARGEITLSSVTDVKMVHRYYLLQASTLAKPAKPTRRPPGGSWDDTEPGYTSGSTNNLYFVDCTVFSDDTFVYSEVSLSSSYEAAKEAYNKAQAAQNAANAKNTVYYQAEAPTGGSYAVNDLWFNTANGNAMYCWDGEKWVSKQFGTDALSVGAVTAEKIDSNSITADKIAIGDFTNYASWKDKTMNTCPLTSFGTGWSTSASTYRTTAPSYCYMPTTLTSKTLGTIQIPVQAGEKLYVEFYYKTSDNWKCTPGASKLRIGAEDGTLLAGFSVAAEAKTDWTRVSGVYEVDERTGAYVQVTILMQAAALPENNAYIWLDDLTIRKMTSGEMIVDGSITAEKINVTDLFSQSIRTEKFDVGVSLLETDPEDVTSVNLSAESVFDGSDAGFVVDVSSYRWGTTFTFGKSGLDIRDHGWLNGGNLFVNGWQICHTISGVTESTVTVAANSTTDVSVSFGVTFADIPHVIPSFRTGSSSANFGLCAVFVVNNSVTTTGCTIRISNAHSAAFYPYIQWMAIGSVVYDGDVSGGNGNLYT